MSDRYQKSEEMLERAQRSIPLGSQTFTKSKTQYPYGVSPYFLVRGKGSHVWDVDGNVYLDFNNALCSVTLGHVDPDVTAAVQAQLQDGVIFSLPHPLETEVAEKIIDMVPCAEKVRFAKNGSDATAGAIRLARAYTKRDHVAVCGYHGWQDWYIGSTVRHLGVPDATRALTHTFSYNDMSSLHQLFRELPNQVAAVILEPMNIQEPKPGYLKDLQAFVKSQGAILIFDETITGFRFSNGGAQELFGVTPDLAAFGKGIANGYPLSAVVGKEELMRLMEDIFFSFTFGGETLSLAAAKATLSKLQTQPVIKTMIMRGERLKAGIARLIDKGESSEWLGISGHPTWTFLNFKEANGYTAWQIKTLFLQEVFARGIITIGTQNMSFAHTEENVTELLSTYSDVFGLLRDAIQHRTLEKDLRCKALEPLFKLR